MPVSTIPIRSMYAPALAVVESLNVLPTMNNGNPIPKQAKPNIVITDKIRSMNQYSDIGFLVAVCRICDSD